MMGLETDGMKRVTLWIIGITSRLSLKYSMSL